MLPYLLLNEFDHRSFFHRAAIKKKTKKKKNCDDQIHSFLSAVQIHGKFQYYHHLHLLLFKTELRISNFQPSHWLAGQRLSYSYLIWWTNVSAIKRAEIIFVALGKNGRQKLFWTGIKSTWESSLYCSFYKTITLLGVAGYKMITINSALRASLVIYLFISSTPS